MILLCGIPSETPLALVINELERKGEPFVLFNQREFESASINWEIANAAVDGELTVNGRSYRLRDFSGVYVRLMDDRMLPELEGEPDSSTRRQTCRQLHDGLTQWMELAPCRVLNRYGAMGSNGSKPFQAQLIMRHGLRTPETLVTTDLHELLEFRRKHGRVVYKSASGVRSIVTELTDKDVSDPERLRALSTCPTQFQQMIDGQDIRVHVIGDVVFPTLIAAQGVDYRYSHSTDGEAAELRAIELPDHVADAVVELCRDLGLDFAGVDLMVDRTGQVYCFEANPCPAFSYYEQHTGQPIAAAVADYLAGDN